MAREGSHRVVLAAVAEVREGTRVAERVAARAVERVVVERVAVVRVVRVLARPVERVAWAVERVVVERGAAARARVEAARVREEEPSQSLPNPQALYSLPRSRLGHHHRRRRPKSTSQHSS